jgi:hypothetical protein
MMAGDEMSFQQRRAGQHRAEQSRGNNGRIAKSLVQTQSRSNQISVQRENLASELAGARRWSGCCTTGFLAVSICWDDRGLLDCWRRWVMQLNEGGKGSSMAGREAPRQEKAARGGRS